MVRDDLEPPQVARVPSPQGGTIPMRARSRYFARVLPFGAALLILGNGATSGISRAGEGAPEPSAGAGTLVVVERSIVQDQGGWQVDYRLRHNGPTATVNPADITAKVDGWVSNSRVASHAVPKLYTLSVSGTTGLSGSGDVIASADEAERCRERAAFRIWIDGDDAPPEPTAKDKPASLNLIPNGIVHVRLRLEHQHFLYGDYDPLLGQRRVELHLGSSVLRDVVPMEREQYLAQPKFTWPAPPEERRDTRHYVSGPDSLHLEAHVPGNQYYRFPERPVRYGTKMRLRFWYLIASGTEGECRARIAQYKDTPTAWKVLTDGAHEHYLTNIGHWVKVEHVFRTELDATTLALDFRIIGGDIGEMWIDDVSLEPVAAGPAGP
jgi:hypothetical protein